MEEACSSQMPVTAAFEDAQYEQTWFAKDLVLHVSLADQ